MADAAIEGARERAARAAVEPDVAETIAMPESDDEEPGASDELVAALAGGAALTFEPDLDEDDDLLPGDRAARAEAAVAEVPPEAEATPEDIAAELAREAAEKAEDDGPARSRGLTAGHPGRRSGPPEPPDPNDDRHDPDGSHAAQERRTGMADISAELVKELRERTGAGFMDCKNALTEADGDLEKAITLLRERGVAQAAKKAGRDAREGLIGELHPHGRPVRRAHRGQLRDRLRRAQRRSSSSSSRTWPSRSWPCARSTRAIESIPADVLAAKKAELLADEAVQKKPENIREQIVDGQLKKWYQQVVPDRAAVPRQRTRRSAS